MIDELSRELGAVGIKGRLRRRILTEAADHLQCDSEAAARFGDPRQVANAFAAELGARASRRAAFSAFVALGAAGLVYAVGARHDGPPSRLSSRSAPPASSTRLPGWSPVRRRPTRGRLLHCLPSRP